MMLYFYDEPTTEKMLAVDAGARICDFLAQHGFDMYVAMKPIPTIKLICTESGKEFNDEADLALDAYYCLDDVVGVLCELDFNGDPEDEPGDKYFFPDDLDDLDNLTSIDLSGYSVGDIFDKYKLGD